MRCQVGCRAELQVGANGPVGGCHLINRISTICLLLIDRRVIYFDGRQIKVDFFKKEDLQGGWDEP
jgi:hypothetical protein